MRHDAGSAASRSVRHVTSICQVKTRASASARAKISRRSRCRRPGSGVRSRSLITSAVGAGVIARTNSSAVLAGHRQGSQTVGVPAEREVPQAVENVATASAGAAGCAAAGWPAPSTQRERQQEPKGHGCTILDPSLTKRPGRFDRGDERWDGRATPRRELAVTGPAGTWERALPPSGADRPALHVVWATLPLARSALGGRRLVEGGQAARLFRRRIVKSSMNLGLAACRSTAARTLRPAEQAAPTRRRRRPARARSPRTAARADSPLR